MISHGKNVKVFCANANRPFAEGVCRKLWLPLGDCTVTTFADGEVSLTINESVRGSDVFLVQSTCKPVNNNLMELLIMIGGGLFGVPGMIAGVPVFAVLYALIWRLINHSLNEKKMPAEEETYISIDCLDEQTGEVLPLCKEEKHKVSPEELEARKNNFFMKIWNPLSGLVITIWKYLLRILNIIWGYIKKAGIFLKNRYVELKNKREKNK